ncbi:chloride channel [Fennellomyces sp. T-0311]|nr:chloride channel [Fennellomyces sp. T-0311]
MATERSSLLERRRQSNYNSLQDFPALPSGDDIQAIHNTSAPPTFVSPGYPSTPSLRDDRHHSRFKLFNKRLGSYDEDRQGLLKENTGLRVWYESYSTIDWIHEIIKEGVRVRKLREAPGWRGRWDKAKDASQAWILVILTGATVAFIAWFIDVVQEWMSDLKQGYCTTNWRYNSKFCCWGKEGASCPDWRTWPEVFNTQSESSSYHSAMFMYTAIGLLLSLIAALMVVFSAEKVVTRAPPPKAVSKPTTPTFANSKLEDIEPPKPQTKIAYYSAGSGIPEVKVILAGFVIKGFLGIKTLFVKSVGMIFSTSSGLNCGKEGPFVHFACSVANIFCRMFDKYNKNESKRREVLSASAAAGVAVAFGAPIGGVLFSLEEIMDPFGTGKIVLFQVSYDKEYHLFELVPFLLCGAFAGFFGAFVSYFNIKYQHLRKNSFIGKYPISEVLAIMLITAITSYWNPFARMGLNEFVMNLFSECSPNNDNGGLCADDVSEIPRLLYLLLTTLVIKMCLTMVTFGCRVPGGIFLPGLIVGAVTGRIIGLVMQYLTVVYPNAWPFTACAEDFATRGECVIPGVYAMVGAAASLTGVTRTTVSLVVIMFELTYSLTYAVPIMIAVMVAKWVADAMFIEGIYDLLIDLQLYPYLDARKEYVHTHTIQDLTENNHATIDIDQLNTVGKLYDKLEDIASMGYSEDGGFPILSNNGKYLEGYIASTELSHALNQLCRYFDNSPYPMTEQECRDVPCYFRRSDQDNGVVIDSADNPVLCLLPSNPSIQTIDSERQERQPLNDFSIYVDQAPLTINLNASMELLMEMFVKLGARYVCLTNSSGKYLGVIHKRTLLAYLKQLEEDE